MSHKFALLICSTFLTIILGLETTSSRAQTTLFNIPTSTTLQRGSWNLEGDFIAKPVSYDRGGYQTYGYRVAYGVSNRTEVGSNFYYTYDGKQSSGQVEFSVKQNVYNNERLGLTASGGTVVFVPVKNTTGDKTHVMVYGVAGKTVEKLNGLSLTGGVYHIFGGRKDFGTRTGAIVGLSQPITKRVSFVSDWFSGKNRLGYLSAGANFSVTKRQYLSTGYNFGNSGRGNNFFSAYYGIVF